MNMEIQKFKNEDEAVESILIKCCDLEGSVAIIDEDSAKAFAEEIVQAIPASVRAEYDDNVVIAAAQYVDIYLASLKSNNGAEASTGIQTQGTGAVADNFDKTSIPKVSKAEQAVIDEVLESLNEEERIKNTTQSKVEKYLYKNQPLADLLKQEKVMVHPVMTDTMRANIEKNLVPGKDNQEKWEEIKKLLDDPTSLVPATLNTKLGRPEGAVIKVEGKGEGTNAGVSTIFNREKLISFLFFNTMMKISSDESTGLGVKIANVVKKQVKTAVGATERASISVTFAGQKDIINKKGCYDFINEPVYKTVEGKQVLDTTVRKIATDLSIRVYTERVNDEGKKEKKESTQRIRGEFDSPKFVRKAFYEKEFPAPENKDFISQEITDKDIEEMKTITQFMLSLAAQNKIGDVEKFGDNMTSIVAKMKKAKTEKVNTAEFGI